MSQAAEAIASQMIFWTLFRALPELSEGWIALSLGLLTVGGIYVGSHRRAPRR